jgi:hypothetical protein
MQRFSLWGDEKYFVGPSLRWFDKFSIAAETFLDGLSGNTLEIISQK